MIIFTDHALLKLKQRGIKKDFVLKALIKPQYQFQSYGDRKVASKKFGNLYLKIIYREEDGNTIIITQHWDKQFKHRI